MATRFPSKSDSLRTGLFSFPGQKGLETPRIPEVPRCPGAHRPVRLCTRTERLASGRFVANDRPACSSQTIKQAFLWLVAHKRQPSECWSFAYLCFHGGILPSTTQLGTFEALGILGFRVVWKLATDAAVHSQFAFTAAPTLARLTA